MGRTLNGGMVARATTPPFFWEHALLCRATAASASSSAGYTASFLFGDRVFRPKESLDPSDEAAQRLRGEPTFVYEEAAFVYAVYAVPFEPETGEPT